MKKHGLQTTNGTTVQTTTEITTPTTETTTTETTTTTKKRHGTIMSYKQFVHMVRVRFALGLIIGILLTVVIWAIIRFSIPAAEPKITTIEKEVPVIVEKEVIKEVPVFDEEAFNAAVNAAANTKFEEYKSTYVQEPTVIEKEVIKEVPVEKIVEKEVEKIVYIDKEPTQEQIHTLANQLFEEYKASYNPDPITVEVEKEVIVEKEVEKVVEVPTVQYVLDTQAMEAKAAELAEVLAQQLFTEYVEGLGDIVTVEEAQTMAAEQANLAVQEWIAKQPKLVVTVLDCVTQETTTITVSGDLGITITDADLMKIVQQKYPDRQINRYIKSYAGSTQIGNRYEFNYEFVEGSTEITNIRFILA